jgi:predicted dehydrogenase
MSICLVGTRWGRYLGTQLRRFYSGPLLVCGRTWENSRRLAKSLHADECIVGWQHAVARQDVSSLILAVPPHLHAETAIAGAEAGKNIFVEKPLATNVRDADAMIEAGRRNAIVVFAGENIPYRPALQGARKLMDEIGSPRLFLASSLNAVTELSGSQKACGILKDVAVHYVRAVRYLFGEPDTIFATRADPAKEDTSEDNVTLVMGSDAGWQATISCSWQASAGRCPEFIVMGNRGGLRIWPDSDTVDLYSQEPTIRTRWLSRVRPWWLQSLLTSPESQRRRLSIPSQDRMGYQAELQDFLGRVDRGRPDTESAEEARRDLEIVMAGYESLERRAPVNCSVQQDSGGVSLFERS